MVTDKEVVEKSKTFSETKFITRTNFGEIEGRNKVYSSIK
jgi:hypothetical protein